MFGNKEGSADCNILWGQDKHHTLTLHTVLQYNNYMKQYAAVLQCSAAVLDISDLTIISLT